MGKSTTKESKKARPVVAVKETPSKSTKKAAKVVEEKKSSRKSKKEASSNSESSSSEEEESFSEFSSESESEDEKPSKKESKKAKKGESSNSESSSEDSDSESSESESEDEKPAKKEKSKKEDSSDSESDSESDSDSESESETEKEEKKDDSSDSDSSNSSDSDSSDSDSEEEEKKEAPKEESKKRKADDDAQEETAKKPKTEEGSCTLFVGKLSWNLDDESLKAGFMHLSGVVSARVVTHKDSGRSRGFGYVDFDTPENAKNAMEQMQGSELDGRPIAIDLSTQRPAADNRAADRAKRHGDVTSPESDTLFVGNLPFEITQDEVREFFTQSAEPSGVRLPTDPESGNLKGFGYVSFNSVDDARKAFTERNGDYLGPGRAARAVRLDYASARPPREGGGRGGFGSRGGGRGGSRGGRGGASGGRGGRGSFGGRGGSRIDVSAATGANKITFDD